MKKTVCVFCGSRSKVNPKFMDTAREVGALLADNGFNLLYGGGSIGLMGASARSAREKNGWVIGVIPEILTGREELNESADEVIITKDLFERKEIMIRRSDAFVILAGGFGTLDELLEVMTLKQLSVHQKPIIIVNTNNYYGPLLDYFDAIRKEGFAPTQRYWDVVDNAKELISILQKALVVETPSKA